MANRKERRFIQKERMKKAGIGNLCKPDQYDNVNECYRSKFAMFWRSFPKMDISILHRHRPRHTKRNLKGVMA